MIIFFIIERLISRLSYSGLEKINDHYMLIWINKTNSKTLIHLSQLFTYSYCFYITYLLSLIICLALFNFKTTNFYKTRIELIWLRFS